MFKPRELPQFGTAGAAAPAAVPLPEADLPQGLGRRLAGHGKALIDHFNSPAWAPDLAEDIGSAEWFRGLGTMLGLTLLALSLGPDSSAVAASPTLPLDSTAREEFRSQMIQPLALGGDTGRRMGATMAAIPAAGVPERTSLKFTATLGQGDSFERMLARAGVSTEDAAAISRLVGGVIATDQIKPGTQFDIALGSRPRPL